MPIRYAIGNWQSMAVAGRCYDGLLYSAIARPVNRWTYNEHDPAPLAAAYAYGLARNHPFIDGNNGRHGCWRLLRFDWRRMQQPMGLEPWAAFVAVSYTGVGAAVEYKVDANEAITGMNSPVIATELARAMIQSFIYNFQVAVEAGHLSIC